MTGPTRFGDFLLLKKLSEDPLGETYRAGRAEDNAVGEILFLRTFSIPGANTAGLAEALHEFESSQRVLAPGLTYPVGGGEVGGVAYVVYPYATGWDLLQVLAAAKSSFSELERDHALLVVERIAKGLTVLHQTEAPGARPCHGFLVPQNVRMTGEGEIELIGLEVGPYLAGLAAAGGLGKSRAYLSPQVLSGAAPTAGDDVFSLGAILWRLLLGQAPPADAAARAAALASAKLSDNQPPPAGLTELLLSSLGEPSARPAHAGFWHRQLTDWMASEQIRTTHFDLAFFIHELFRRQIQTEKDEIANEKQLEIGAKTAEPRGEAATSEGEMSGVTLRPDLSGMVPGPAVSPGTPAAAPASDTAVVAPPGRSKVPLVAALAAVAVIVVVAGWLMLGGRTAPEPPPVQAAPSPPPSPPPPPPATGELQLAQEELERLVRERTQAVGEQISAEYDEQIRSLREQLEQAREAEAEALRNAVQSAPPATPPAAATPPDAAPPAAATPAVTETADREPPPSEPAVTPPPSEPAVTPPPSEPAVTPPPSEPAEPETTDIAATGRPSAPATTPTATPPPPATTRATPPPPATPPPSPPPPVATPPPPPPPSAITPPQRISMPRPVFPARARLHRKEATVIVKVLVDANGKVVDAQPVIDKPDPYGFSESAVDAARQAKFRPARSEGLPIRMWTTVVISFKQ